MVLVASLNWWHAHHSPCQLCPGFPPSFWFALGHFLWSWAVVHCSDLAISRSGYTSDEFSREVYYFQENVERLLKDFWGNTRAKQKSNTKGMKMKVGTKNRKHRKWTEHVLQWHTSLTKRSISSKPLHCEVCSRVIISKTLKARELVFSRNLQKERVLKFLCRHKRLFSLFHALGENIWHHPGSWKRDKIPLWKASSILIPGRFHPLSWLAHCLAAGVELDDYMVEEFLNEIIIMRKFKHPNVMKLLGVTVHDDKPCIVLPLMMTNLKCYLRQNSVASVHSLCGLFLEEYFSNCLT